MHEASGQGGLSQHQEGWAPSDEEEIRQKQQSSLSLQLTYLQMVLKPYQTIAC